jgi:uncharacterized cupin superfamily protein
MSRVNHPVVDPSTVEPKRIGPGGGYEAHARSIGQALGLSKLGCRVVELEPGCTGWPRHIHHANEELFIILEGDGTLDYGDTTYPVSAGDIIGAGTGPGTAHRLRNTGAATLRYIAVSTMEAPEVLEYPDSGKIGAIAGSAPGGDARERAVTAFFPADAAVDYWHGENGDG